MWEESKIAFKRDILKRANEIDSSFTVQEYDEAYTYLCKLINEDLKEGNHTCIDLPIGYFYADFDKLGKTLQCNDGFNSRKDELSVFAKVVKQKCGLATKKTVVNHAKRSSKNTFSRIKKHFDDFKDI